MRERLESGFFARYLSGPNVLDIGYRGGNRPDNLPIVPQATGVDHGYPGYDGKTLPFEDASQDAVHSSHCLEHIPDPIAALAEWFRVLRAGGFLVLTVPHQHLFERRPTRPSRHAGRGHLRFYTPAKLLAEIEAALPAGEYRVRSLRDNDAGFNYHDSPDVPPRGCCEIEVVIERIARPPSADNLQLTTEARAAIEGYCCLIEMLLRLDAAGSRMEPAILEAYGKAVPIPPFAVLQPRFPNVPMGKLQELLSPMVDPAEVDAAWYLRVHPDAARWANNDPSLMGEHYRHAGYFDLKVPSLRIGLYG